MVKSLAPEAMMREQPEVNRKEAAKGVTKVAEVESVPRKKEKLKERLKRPEKRPKEKDKRKACQQNKRKKSYLRPWYPLQTKAMTKNLKLQAEPKVTRMDQVVPPSADVSGHLLPKVLQDEDLDPDREPDLVQGVDQNHDQQVVLEQVHGLVLAHLQPKTEHLAPGKELKIRPFKVALRIFKLAA